MAADTVLDATPPHRHAARPAFQPLAEDTLEGLVDLLAALVASGEARSFHPHPFDRHAIGALCRAAAGPRDEYWVAVEEHRVVAYGLLRGWAEGYAVPSLGIAVHPAARGRGLARSTMMHLHDVALARGASRVRLKVYRDNATAIHLYESLGYRLEPLNERELVGFLELGRQEESAA